MTTPEVADATESVLSASLRVLTAERDPQAHHYAEHELAFGDLAKAARALTVAVSLLPWRDRPVGWDDDLGKAAFAVDVDSEAVQ